MAKYPNFIGDWGQTQSVIANPSQTMNFYLERQSAGASNSAALFPVPGYTAVATVPELGYRGGISADGRMFVVMGPTLYEMSVDNVTTSRGTVAQDSNPATISYNGLAGGQLFITSGNNGYLYTLSTNVLTQVLTGECLMGGFCHGYFLSFNRTNGRVRLSDLNDGSSWPALQFFQRSQFADPWQAMFVDSSSFIWLPGTQTFEVWYDSGASPQPFTPLTGLVGRYGIAAPFAWGLVGNDIFWLMQNQDGTAKVIDPRGQKTVSTYAIEHQLAMSTLSDAEAIVHQYDGHAFLCFSLPTAGRTWAYDVQQDSWCGRGKWIPALNRWDVWSARGHVYAYGKNFVGDRATGTIAYLDRTSMTELDGSGIRRVRVAPALIDEHQRRPMTRLELLLESGLGTASGQGVNPLVMLRTSADGGQTWGNERIGAAGRQGQYAKRLYWGRLGALQDPVVEVSMTDPIPWRIVDAWLNTDEYAQAS